MLKPEFRFAAVILLCAVHAGLAQPRLSLGLTGGVQVYPSREKYNLSRNQKLPFFLQTRYGYSFNNFFDASKSFLQVIAGIHLGVL